MSCLTAIQSQTPAAGPEGENVTDTNNIHYIYHIIIDGRVARELKSGLQESREMSLEGHILLPQILKNNCTSGLSLLPQRVQLLFRICAQLMVLFIPLSRQHVLQKAS